MTGENTLAQTRRARANYLKKLRNSERREAGLPIRRNPTNRPWSKDDIELLLREYPKGHTPLALEALFPGRLATTIRKRASILGLTNTGGRSWTDEEEQVLRVMTKHGATRSQISLILGRSVDCISHKRRHWVGLQELYRSKDGPGICDSRADTIWKQKCREANFAFVERMRLYHPEKEVW